MGRPTKETIDYFPHYVKSGRTIFILESQYGNDGYAFWFKLLELLGETDGHCYDCSTPANWAYLLAKTRCTEDTAESILTTLVSLGKIDKDLWETERKIWCQNLVGHASYVYKMRRQDVPQKPQGVRVSTARNTEGCEFLQEETPRGTQGVGVSTKRNRQSKVKESKVKKSKEENSSYQSFVVSCENDEADGLDGFTAKGLKDFFNREVEANGSVLKSIICIKGKRLEHVRARIREYGLEGVEEAIRKATKSDFLNGKNGKGFTATFDWIIAPNNFVKVLEGNYDNNEYAKDRNQNTARRGTAAPTAAEKPNYSGNF